MVGGAKYLIIAIAKFLTLSESSLKVKNRKLKIGNNKYLQTNIVYA